MNWMDTIGGLVQQYSGGQGTGAAPAPDAEQHFDQYAQAAPGSVLAQGLAAAFRSDQTPAFGNMVSQMFGNSSGQQQASVLNTLLASAGPGVLAQLASSGGLGSTLGSLLGSGQTQVTPQQAAQVPPEEVQQLAAHVEKHDPSIVDRVSQVYSEHPTLIKMLGAGALAIAMREMSKR